MNEQKYSNQAITEYLLGSLPEAEAEQFDELSIVDDEFVEALKSAENDLIDTYARGELTGTRLAKFESYYLASPVRREKVNFAVALLGLAEKDLVSKNEENTAFVKLNPKQTRAGFFRGLNIFATPNLVWQWGPAVAAIALIILGSWLWLENARLGRQADEIQAQQNELRQREQDLQNQLQKERSANSEAREELARASEESERLEQELEKVRTQNQELAAQKSRSSQMPSSKPTLLPPQISIATFVLLPQMRSSNQLQNLSIPEQTNYVAIALQLEADDFQSYRVALTDLRVNKNLWQSSNLKAKSSGEEKTLNIQFPAKLLKSQVYSLTVSGVDARGKTEILGDYPFRAVVR